MRFYCGAPKNCSLIGLIGEMAWIPSIVRRDIENVRLYNQIIKMPIDRLTRKIFQYEKYCEGKWYNNIKQIFNCLEEEDTLASNNVINIKFVKTKLMEMCKETWCQQLHSQFKLKNYMAMEPEFEVANHLRCNLKKSKRSLITQVCLGTLGLEVERGRYSKNSKNRENL